MHQADPDNRCCWRQGSICVNRTSLHVLLVLLKVLNECPYRIFNKTSEIDSLCNSGRELTPSPSLNTWRIWSHQQHQILYASARCRIRCLVMLHLWANMVRG